MKSDSLGLVIVGGVALLILYFYTENKQQSVQANTSGLNNSFPTFNLLYPISASTYVGTSAYSGLAGGLPTMYETPSNFTYYGGNSWGNSGQFGGYTDMGQVGGFLGSMFGG